MAQKRPCRICKRWFQPHPRAKDRQRVCSSPSCQRERHRRACRGWHRGNAGYDREDRLRRRLRVEEVGGGAKANAMDPLGRVDWRAARDAVGLEVAVAIEETAKVLWAGTRDAVMRQQVMRA